MPRRNSTRVQRARLAGKEAVGLNDAFVDPANIPEASAEPRVRIDAAGLADHLGLTADERRLLAGRVAGEPLTAVMERCGWTYRRAKAIEESLQHKLANAGRRRIERFVMHGTVDSRRLAYRESFPSGGRAYTLAELGDSFREIMAAEKANLFVPYFDAVTESVKSSPIWAVSYRRATMDLEKKLTAAKANLARIRNEAQDKRRDFDLITAKITAAEASAKKSAEDDVLAGRVPGAKRTAEIAKLRTEAREIEESFDAYVRATERAQADVDEAASEMAAKEMEILRIKFAPALKEFFDFMDQAPVIAGGIRKTLLEVGSANLTDLAFPMRDPARADSRARRSRIAQMNFYNACFELLNLQQENALQIYERAKEAAA